MNTLTALEQLDMTDKIVGSMATFPARFNILPKVIASIIDQVDYLFVYVNQSDTLPDCLNHPKIYAFLGTEHAGDLSANGKVYALKYVQQSIFFTLDDDLIYPADYVDRMHATLQAFHYQVGVSIHASIFSPDLSWYYERSSFYGLRMSLSEHKLVTLIGSGGFCYHQKHLQCNWADFADEVRVDITYSALAKAQKIPLLCIQRPADWIQFYDLPGLWHQFGKQLSHHTDYCCAQQHWDFETHRTLVKDFFQRTFGYFDAELARQLAFDSDVTDAILHDTTPITWWRGVPSFRGRRDYLRIRTGVTTWKQRVGRWLSKRPL